jgi:hypothetical protein
MAYDNSHVWVVYNVLTAAQLTQISDNIDWLHTQFTICGPNGRTFFLPHPLTLDWASSTTMTANRIYLTRIIIFSPIKLKSFLVCPNGASPATRWGGGLYDTSGNLLVSGVTAQISGTTAANPTPASATLIPAGVYLMAMTGDAAGLPYGREQKSAAHMTAMNAIVVAYGYTATASALGVLPASVNTALTSINANSDAFANWQIETTTY